MSLSGTPLNDTLIALHQLIPDFKSKNKVEKVQCVILTDGESNHLTYHSEHCKKILGMTQLRHILVTIVQERIVS